MWTEEAGGEGGQSETGTGLGSGESFIGAAEIQRQGTEC